MLRTLAELGVHTEASMTFEQLEQASDAVAASKQTTGFKVGERGLYVEARQVKAMLKESTNVGYHEFVQQATLEFQVLTMRDCLTPEQWADLWVHAQENGLGALRSQGFGRFFIEQWERIS
jgi:hypothetical protein